MQIQTNITFQLLKKMQKRGLLFCSIGAIFLFIGANFLSIQTLEEWGIWMFLTAIAVIYIGLKPYQKLKHHKLNPSALTIRKGHLEFFQYQKAEVKLPIKYIEKILFREKNHTYGIFVQSKEKNVFFPYFSKQSYEKLLSDPRLQNIVYPDDPH